MATKVNYNSTQGLVQELDPTGAGGFLVNGSEIGQKTLTFTEVNATASNAKVAVEPSFDIFLVTTSGPGQFFSLAAGNYYGQIVSVFHKSNTDVGNGAGSLHVAAKWGGTDFKTLNPDGMSTTTTLNASGKLSLRAQWIGDRWININRSQ